MRIHRVLLHGLHALVEQDWVGVVLKVAKGCPLIILVGGIILIHSGPKVHPNGAEGNFIRIQDVGLGKEACGYDGAIIGSSQTIIHSYLFFRSRHRSDTMEDGGHVIRVQVDKELL